MASPPRLPTRARPHRPRRRDAGGCIGVGRIVVAPRVGNHTDLVKYQELACFNGFMQLLRNRRPRGIFLYKHHDLDNFLEAVS